VGIQIRAALHKKLAIFRPLPTPGRAPARINIRPRFAALITAASFMMRPTRNIGQGGRADECNPQSHNGHFLFHCFLRAGFDQSSEARKSIKNLCLSQHRFFPTDFLFSAFYFFSVPSAWGGRLSRRSSMKKITKFLALMLLAIGITGASSAEAAISTPEFIRKATIGNGFEIMSSRIALDRSENSEVLDFARRMIDVHNQADDQLRETIYNSGFHMKNMPNDLDAKHRSMLRQLENTPSGEEFDRLYIRMQTEGHRDALKLYKGYTRTGKNPAFRDLARDLLPEIQEHHEHVRTIRFYR
jgi:putative membrane protein